MMIIRSATKFDIEHIMVLMTEYSLVSPISILKYSTNPKHVRTLFTHILSGMGEVFVCDDVGTIKGMLACIKQNNIWNPDVKCIHELCYWVSPEYRHTTVGYRLLKHYIKYCEDLKAKHEISYYTISKMVNSPDLKYDKFGFSKLEETWRA